MSYPLHLGRKLTIQAVYQRLLCVVLTVLVCLLFLQTGFYPWLSDLGLNILFKVRGARETSQSIVIVGIDEASLRKHGPMPFQRRIHAALLHQLRYAKVVGFDVLFAYPTPDDGLFVEAIKKGPPVVMAVARDYQKNVIRPAVSFQEVVTLGHIETLLGADGIVRRVPYQRYDLPAFSLAMYLAGQGQQEEVPEATNRYINFYGPEFSFLYLSYDDVLNGEYPPDFFKDRYVFVGSKAVALGDVHISPFSRDYPVPGVEIQATILNNILENQHIRPFPQIAWGLGALCLILPLLIWYRVAEAYNLLVNIVTASCIAVFSTILFFSNVFISPFLPIFVLALAYSFHLIFWWLSNTIELIRQLKVLDLQLVKNVNTVFKAPPASFASVRKKQKPPRLLEGFDRHLSHLHSGIQTLSLQENFINHLLSKETPPLILWQKDQGTVVLVNSRFTRLWRDCLAPGKELPSLEAFYRFVNEKYVADDTTSSKILAMPVLLEKDQTVDIFTAESGKKCYHRVVVHRVVDDLHGFEGVLASLTDVTEIRELERLKGEIMNVVSHELKLPLTTIMGFSEMLTESLEGSEKTFATAIFDQSNRLAKMIEDFLNIARMESGKYVIRKYPFDLLSVVHDAATGVMHAAAKKNIDIVYDLPRKVSPLLGDESLLVQVILNVMDNAIKFSPAGGTVVVRVKEQEKQVLILVEDSGSGVAQEDTTKIFEKFQRGTGQHLEAGFGLGLNFVSNVLENHLGSISVEDSSELGGAKFIITLPKKTV
ncbi:MAG: hypothetical protein CSA20_07870 [Deltaproteobacteria bacterium]|nr:MAG: hypothetical protein CSA20_07870 [Deltaproteobacteria bacterium]